VISIIVTSLLMWRYASMVYAVTLCPLVRHKPVSSTTLVII